MIEWTLMCLGMFVLVGFVLPVMFLVLPQYVRDLVRGRGNSLRGMTDDALRKCVQARREQVSLAESRLTEATDEMRRRTAPAVQTIPW